MHMVNSRIKNINSLDTEIGPVRFLAPDVVLRELDGLSMDSEKSPVALAAIEQAKKMPEIKIEGRKADGALYPIIRKNLACTSAVVYVLPCPTCCGEFGYGYATVMNFFSLESGSASKSFSFIHRFRHFSSSFVQFTLSMKPRPSMPIFYC